MSPMALVVDTHVHLSFLPAVPERIYRAVPKGQPAHFQNAVVGSGDGDDLVVEFLALRRLELRHQCDGITPSLRGM